MSKTGELRVAEYLRHIIEAIECIERYTIDIFVSTSFAPPIISPFILFHYKPE